MKIVLLVDLASASVLLKQSQKVTSMLLMLMYVPTVELAPMFVLLKQFIRHNQY